MWDEGACSLVPKALQKTENGSGRGDPERTDKMLEFNRSRTDELAQQATSELLMDKITVYRAAMEPEAVDIFERELARRGVTQLQINAHDDARRRTAIMLPDGTARRCAFCERPAMM